MLRVLLALLGSTLVALAGSALVLALTDARIRSPDTAGIVAVSLAIAWVLGLLVYAPVAWLLRRRGMRSRILAALAIGVGVNAPLFALLFILDRVGGVFADGEALTIALLALAIGATHGLLLFRERRAATRHETAAADEPQRRADGDARANGEELQRSTDEDVPSAEGVGRSADEDVTASEVT